MTRANLFVIAVFVLAAAPFAGAQDDNQPPRIVIGRWTVVHFDGTTEIVYQLNPPINDLFHLEFEFLHTELDTILVDFLVTDGDWLEPDFDPAENTDQSIYIGSRACSNLSFDCQLSGFSTGCGAFGTLNTSPVAPVMQRFFPFAINPAALFGSGETTGFAPSGMPLEVVVRMSYVVPEFIGANQDRLRGIINYDIRYDIIFAASNEAAPSEPGSIDLGCVTIQVIENPVFSPPSAPAFADAGADQTVPVNQLTVLDGSRTFDSNNLGFDVNDPDIFAKDLIRFAWEWISGPVRVNPVQSNENDPLATVEFTAAGTYVYRLTATDLSTSRASTDSVTITVLQELPVLLAPTAVILGPSTATVGALITLDGRQSSDPNGDPLTYQWTQTNALGGPLTSTLSAGDIANVFQPLSGATSSVATWQATQAGVYYFRLSVNDGTFTSTTPVFTIRVTLLASDTGVPGGGSSGGNSNGADDGGGGTVTPTTCGVGGLLPLALAPLLLAARRRR